MNSSAHSYQMLGSPAMNLCLANVRRVVLGSASLNQLSYSLQPSVSVEVSVNSLSCFSPVVLPYIYIVHC